MQNCVTVTHKSICYGYSKDTEFGWMDEHWNRCWNIRNCSNYKFLYRQIFSLHIKADNTIKLPLRCWMNSWLIWQRIRETYLSVLTNIKRSSRPNNDAVFLAVCKISFRNWLPDTLPVGKKYFPMPYVKVHSSHKSCKLQLDQKDKSCDY